MPGLVTAEFLTTVAQPLAQHPAILYFDASGLSAEGCMRLAYQPAQEATAAAAVGVRINARALTEEWCR